MDWDTLIWATALLGIVSWLAWYCGRCDWHYFTNIMDCNVLGKVGRRLSVHGSESGQRERKGDHDPDLAFHRSIRLPQSIIAVGVLVLVFYMLLGWLVTWKAMSYYDKHLKVTPVVFSEMGLPYDVNAYAQTGQHVIQWLDDRRENQAATLFLFQLTGQKESTVYNSEVKEYVKVFVETEIEGKEGKTAPVALQRLLVKIGGKPAVEENAEQVRNFLRSTILTSNLNPMSFDQMVTRLNLEGTLEEDLILNRASKATLPSKEVAPTTEVDNKTVERSTSRSSETSGKVAYLAAVKYGIAEKFEEYPGLKVVTAAVYERIRKDVLRFQRVRVLFFGEIQEATIAAYLLALVLLGSRARILATQRAILTRRFADFIADPDKAPHILTALTDRNTILPDSSPSSKAATDREIVILNAYKAFLDRDPYTKAHSFVIGALVEIYSSWDSIWTASGSTTSAIQLGRESLSSLVARNEARLERVEYSLIDYIVWVMPSLGFIGTVVGISQALGDADEVVRASDQVSQAEAITLVTSVLGVAFDTTLIALVCSIPVMLLISWFRSGESRFLLDVDQRISASLFR